MQAASTEGDGGGAPTVATPWSPSWSPWPCSGCSWPTTAAPGAGSGEVPAEEAARRHDFIHSIDHSPITHNLRRLGGSVRPWSLIHWSGGPDPVGILALATAILASVAAWVLARPDPAPREPRVDSPAHAVTPVP
jgi:hypothetical protein